ncbi:unnamed protein product [Bursaphelenchus xylophilus]|uniref:Dymeclin n=1 Tax=Bursaphelenchus xylophilus TaxID=6326 RepID=A0A1I7SSI8_BURXY|nr:unnamed protein product [Bursaphelenchus xylophilus]CAG9097503.1 unnamed protein product [Bursaphelenchus xylophilus]
MGTVISTVDDIADCELLKKLCDKDNIDENDPFWNKLFSFNIHLDLLDKKIQKALLSKAEGLLQSLLHTSNFSGNFSSLIQVFFRYNKELIESVKCENKVFVWQVTNCLLLIRYILNFFAWRLSPQQFAKTFSFVKEVEDEESSDSDYENTAEEFVIKLIKILVEIPVIDITRELHGEVIRTLLCLLSTQLYEENVTETSPFLGYIMKCEHARELVRCLLENFLYQTQEISVYKKPAQVDSLVISLASSMWSALSKTVMTTEEETAKPPESDAFPPQSVSSLSVTLLLILVCRPKFQIDVNPYKSMLSLFQNAQEVSSLANLEASFKLDFSALYGRLCVTCHQKQPMLLLYMVLHANSFFRNFVLSRINLEDLVLPVLKVLNDGLSTTSVGSHSHQTYLAMIVILILSEDDFFCKLIHEVNIKSVPWYPNLTDVSLGGLIVCVFAKTIHTNTVKTRDRYLHTNCLAALANMSSSFKYLSPYVSQKLIGLLETMTKRHSKLIQSLRENAEIELADDEEPQGSELNRDIMALEEGIRMILEVINSALCSNLRFNANLIYSILYKRELFEQYHHHPMFHDLVWNIYMVINHFSSRIENVDPTSVTVVLDAIKKAAIQWPTDRLKKFPDLKYRYVEDENTIDFFVPYAWRLVFESAGVFFDSHLVKLFKATSI